MCVASATGISDTFTTGDMWRSVLVCGAIFCVCLQAETKAEEWAWHTLTMGVTECNPNKPKLAVAGLEGGGNHPKLVAMAELLGMDEHG
jgi:hypothetical protein